ncbi:hypothetical protein KIPB_007587 [Kipferlia bialata]|uniref:Uncharacterized protein n=1 Tax=Kipferlia bialata TaxID=797122 RepID=A0A9K3CYU4_9EUKA|nr:hypothetical protein KIPB_007587 [Kipferlia bialata]|eukprot:g7587.t1
MTHSPPATPNESAVFVREGSHDVAPLSPEITGGVGDTCLDEKPSKAMSLDEDMPSLPPEVAAYVAAIQKEVRDITARTLEKEHKIETLNQNMEDIKASIVAQEAVNRTLTDEIDDIRSEELEREHCLEMQKEARMNDFNRRRSVSSSVGRGDSVERAGMRGSHTNNSQSPEPVERPSCFQPASSGW